MTPRIRSLTVRDFRSIRGSITIPMDSPVVLIHGRNGAGKTSLLSAMELALTGKMPSLDRLDSNLRHHLVHKRAQDASISICVDGLGDQSTAAEFHITGSDIVGEGALENSLRTHYSERCYLAQSTLSRLLDIYQAVPSATGASPLTRFVKELLGLDSLEALIDGLHDAGDVRRLRGGAVRYWDVRDQLPSVEAEVARLKNELAANESQAQLLSKDVRELVGPHWPDKVDLPIKEMIEFLGDQTKEVELQRMARNRRDIADTLAQLQSIESPEVAQQREGAETAAQDADQVLQQWLATIGKRLEDVFQELTPLFADLPYPIQKRPEYARASARKVVATELERCKQLLVRDAEARERATAIDQDHKAQIARLHVLEQKIAQHSKEAGQLAQALATLVPHIHSDECPVCSRNFREVSDTPLLGSVAARVTALTQSAGSLTALSEERANTVGVIAAKSRELAGVQALLLAEESKQDLSVRMEQLQNALRTLDALEGEAKRGELLFTEATGAAQRLAGFRLRDQRSTSIRESTSRIAQMLGLESIDPNDPLRAALDRLMAHVQAKEAQLVAEEADRHKAEATLREIVLKQKVIDEIRQRATEREGAFRAMNAAKHAGDRAIGQARNLLKVAQVERALIIGRVFNESLNATWRDLFVRLAPDEPFVPAFALPGLGKGDVEAKLETHYQRGGKGGNPRAMLSTGNLNTAALTLFLALHLSVQPRLPWLIIDDPVQSMDEVHVSQFAALLRTLSKKHGRQIVIAVHEKPLFDYLCLELSPAFAGDRLITAELGRTADGISVGDVDVRDWKPDLAIAA